MTASPKISLMVDGISWSGDVTMVVVSSLLERPVVPRPGQGDVSSSAT